MPKLWLTKYIRKFGAPINVSSVLRHNLEYFLDAGCSIKMIGHQHLIKDFQQLVKSGRLAQGYIFFGEPEVGKFYFSKHLANFLENSEWAISQRPLQDSLLLESATGIQEMRSLQSFLWQKPVFSQRRLAVVNDADNLTPEAQQAILKITEDPPEHSFIILVVKNLENLLPTLVSRFQKIYFGKVSDKELIKLTNELNAIKQSTGRPGRLMRLLQKDPTLISGDEYAKKFFASRGSQRSNLIKSLVDAQKEQPAILDAFFEFLILELRKDLQKNAVTIAEVLHRLFLIKSYNVNKRLQLEAIS